MGGFSSWQNYSNYNNNGYGPGWGSGKGGKNGWQPYNQWYQNNNSWYSGKGKGSGGWSSQVSNGIGKGLANVASDMVGFMAGSALGNIFPAWNGVGAQSAAPQNSWLPAAALAPWAQASTQTTTQQILYDAAGNPIVSQSIPSQPTGWVNQNMHPSTPSASPMLQAGGASPGAPPPTADGLVAIDPQILEMERKATQSLQKAVADSKVSQTKMAQQEAALRQTVMRQQSVIDMLQRNAAPKQAATPPAATDARDAPPPAAAGVHVPPEPTAEAQQ